MKTINMTFKIEEANLTTMESYMRWHLDVVDFRIVPDTEHLYNTDNTFRKLVKAEKFAKSEKMKYINLKNK